VKEARIYNEKGGKKVCWEMISVREMAQNLNNLRFKFQVKLQHEHKFVPQYFNLSRAK